VASEQFGILMRAYLQAMTPRQRRRTQSTHLARTILDGVYDCRANRSAIFNRGMIPNIPENPHGRRQRFDAAIFEDRLRTIELVFA
jgi:hypothetical protein